MRAAKIIGLGKYLPSRRLTNKDLEKIVDTSDEWITTRTGIKERRIAKEGESASMLAYKASQEALKRAGLTPDELDLIIVATITPDMNFPSTACFLQKHLKAVNASCFDLSAACAGFVYAAVTAWQYIASGLYDNILIVGSEVISSITDFKDRSTCVLFGDGAGAAVLTYSKTPGFISSDFGSDGFLSDILSVPGGGSQQPISQKVLDDRSHYIKMKGNELFRIAVRLMIQTAEISLKKAGLKTEDVSLFIPHQANKRIIDAVSKRLGIDSQKIFLNVDQYGNMSSASTAVALCEAWEKGMIKKDDIIVLDAFGGGLVWGSCVIKWT
ncbi:MAG: ketoacyl-ACP synthase III [Candidatus Omnitrophica bacterium]|nr:ketoacyl-ACP synthase III [Candidatus Omnitrophota bacterium]